MSNKIEDFGARIQRTREARGMNASELARLTHVTPTAVWNWENKNRIPQTKTLASLATVLNVSKEWLLTGQGDINVVFRTDVDLSSYPLEELMKAINKKGFVISVTPKQV